MTMVMFMMVVIMMMTMMIPPRFIDRPTKTCWTWRSSTR